MKEPQALVFSRWRKLVFASMFVGWMFYYFVRQTLPASTPELVENQGFTKDDIGFIASSFHFSYGFGKFINSILSDHLSSRKMFSFGLVSSGVCCLLFPLSGSVLLCALVWLVSGYLQGFGWAPCAILLRKWYSPSQLGTWWSVLTCGGNAAAVSIPFIVIYITSVSSWKWSYYVLGTGALLTGFTVLYTIKDSPIEIGFPAFGQKKKSAYEEKSVESKSSLSWFGVFFLPNLWVVSVMYACSSLARYCVMLWSQLYFIQVAHKSKAVAAACISSFPIGGFLGNVAAGYASDIFVTPRTMKTATPRSPVSLITAIFLFVFLHLFATTIHEDTSEVWLSVLMFALGFLLDAMISVVGLLSMDVVPTHMAGSAHGLACGIAQVGAFLSGWPFARAVDDYGWVGAYSLLELVAAVILGLSVYLTALLLRDLRRNENNTHLQ